MKRLMILAAALIAFATGAAAQDAVGVWQTEVDDGAYAHITIAPCGNAVCGVISRTFNADGEYQSENIGKTLVIDMVSQGGGAYEGSVWRPSNNKIYIGKMDVDGNALRLRGCVAGGLICSSQNWVRVG
ncbi:DUF2147 domain-containing protein [Loktanella sp. Alg231-35]|uniref:DUF2147 domain-containing protein n=1 Tax=Loktanella sp. Alg231-35 TaxID=1922220 RepID=UPI000D556D5D|nr:DUF2147 domain-containing protein [Loktanella sp. Alg231-35]